MSLTCPAKSHPNPAKINYAYGTRFGRIVFIMELEKENKNRRFLGRCDCGKEKVFQLTNVTSGKSQSCGCLRNDQRAVRFTKHRQAFKGKVTATYRVWLHMNGRCHTPSDEGYKYYGERGIYVCARWRDSFENFVEDMGEKPPHLSIDRIDVNGPYSKENCRWATQEQQANNKRNTRLFSFGGITQSISQWCRLYSLSRKTLTDRIDKKGMTFEQALTDIGII